MKTLWTTCVGSHLWRMDRPDSDVDLFEVYAVPTVDILSGVNRGFGSHQLVGGDIDRSRHEIGKVVDIDRSRHEIGKVVDMIIKGNVNFLVGVVSDIVTYQRGTYLDDLKELVVKYGQTKACVPSIRGLAMHNYKKFIVGSDTARDYDIEKKCGTINRTLLFGINVLEGNGFHFRKTSGQTSSMVKWMMADFEEVVEISDLPEKTDPYPFREYLRDLRIDDLKEWGKT